MKIITTAYIALILTSSLFAKPETIAKIEEASGICFFKQTKSLYVVADEGNIYELSKKGKIKRKKYLGKYDLEGIACDKELLYLAVEGKDSVMVVDSKDFKILKIVPIKKKFKGTKVLESDKEHGVEAIEIIDGNIYLSNQSYNKWPKKDASVIFGIDGVDNKKAKIVKVIDHGYVDIAGMSWHNNILYMVSDKKNLLIEYDINKNKTIKTSKLPKMAQEGICFDDKDILYIADDKGRIVKFKEF